DIYRSDDPFLLGLSYTDYRPGMRIYLHASHENYKESDVIEIEEINGYDLTSDTYQHPKDGDLHFITTDGTKIIWNQTPISCFIELDQTTMFLKDMFSHYQAEADKRLKDEKNDHLLELLIVNEHKRCKLERQWKRL
ncbi:hypothetical protein ACTHQ2_23445, partial [Bacillus subtilis]|uniref:hypothetical protein n=1 Tax=Bacillus subtilis TaxID=1423 RepID=UPI003F7C466B